VLLPLIQKRRSIRRYQDRPVEKSKVDQLIQAALRAPSSRGINPLEFIVVDDGDLLERLSQAKPHGAAFLKNAPLGIIVCAEREKSDVWVEDASIASIFIHLMAASLELGSCWIQIRKRDHASGQSASAFVAELLGIPPTLEVESIIAIGYPEEEKRPHGDSSLKWSKIHRNRYGQDI
jgi:nitroreductase